MAPRAEGPSASPFKHLERQPALSALNDTKGVSGAVANPPLSAEPHAKSLSERAREAMDLWFGTLSHTNRRKLKTPRSSWARQGGNIVAVGLRPGKTARRNKKLKRERGARFKADQAAYQARRVDQARIVS